MFGQRDRGDAQLPPSVVAQPSVGCLLLNLQFLILELLQSQP